MVELEWKLLTQNQLTDLQAISQATNQQLSQMTISIQQVMELLTRAQTQPQENEADLAVEATEALTPETQAEVQEQAENNRNTDSRQ